MVMMVRVVAVLAVFVVMVVVVTTMLIVHMLMIVVMAAMLVMHMVMIACVQEVRIDVELGVQVKAAQVKHLLERHLSKMHHLLRRTRVHVLETVLQSLQRL